MSLRFFDNYNNEVLALVSLREHGDMRIKYCGEKKRSNNENRIKYLKSIGITEEAVVSGLLHHSGNVAIVNDFSPFRFIPETDGLITREKNIPLSVTSADCYPVFFFDPVVKTIAIAHVGWKGAVAQVIPNILAEMVRLGSNPRNMQVAVGPGICHKCFEFSKDDLEKLGEYNDEKYFFKKKNGSAWINLRLIIGQQLISRGIRVNSGNIDFSDECTCCSDSEKFFSARRDGAGKKSVENMLAVIMLRE